MTTNNNSDVGPRRPGRAGGSERVMSEFRRIPCVVYIWPNPHRTPIAVGFTSTYRAAKRIEREVKRFHAEVGITEAWNWPTVAGAA